MTSHSDEGGALLCITGRLIEEGEAEILNTSAIAAAEDPLLTAAQYQSKGQPMPTVQALVQASVEHYAQQSAAIQAAKKNGSTTGDLAAEAADLAQQASDLQAITKQSAGQHRQDAGGPDRCGRLHHCSRGGPEQGCRGQPA